MNQDVQELVDRANLIISKAKEIGSGNRYPNELKNIVADLRNTYKLNVKQITTLIPISAYSAREWPKKKNQKFRKISVVETKTIEEPRQDSPNNSHEMGPIIFNLKILKVLISLLIFESIVFHLIFLRIQMVQ